MPKVKKLNLNDLNVKSFETSKETLVGGDFRTMQWRCHSDFDSVIRCTNIYYNCI